MALMWQNTTNNYGEWQIRTLTKSNANKKGTDLSELKMLFPATNTQKQKRARNTYTPDGII
jgi:hypothetical protein